MSQYTNRSPVVQPELAREIAPGVMVIPDQYINLVPNVGIVIGTDAVLVIESGMGIENGQRVLHKAMEVAGSKPLLFTTTHFHPEHAFGTQVFKGHATILTNTTGQLTRAERDVLAALPEQLVLQIEGLSEILFCHTTPRSNDTSPYNA